MKGLTGRGGAVLRDLAPLLLAVVPLLFAFPVIDSMVSTVEALVASPHPFFGDVSGTAADARAIALGIPLYQDPAVGYTPLTYTPLYNVIGAAGQSFHDWDGWPMLVNSAALFALVGIAAFLAYRPPDRRWPLRAAVLAGAIGMGAIAYWMVGFVPFNVIYAPRPDHLAWAFSLGGLVLMPAVARGSRPALIGSIALLTFGWWTKQPVVFTAVAAGAWLLIAVIRGRAARRTLIEFGGGLGIAAAASLGLAALLTDGWSTAFVIEMPGDRAHPFGFERTLQDLKQAIIGPAIVAAAFWAVALFPGEARAPWRWKREEGSRIPPEAAEMAGVLGLFLLIDVPASVYLRDAVGVAHNMFDGLAWALGFLAALAWGVSQRGRTSALAAAGVVIALFALTESPNVVTRIHEETSVLIPRKFQQAIIFQQPGALLDYAEDNRVYHPAYPGIGVDDADDIFPGQDNVTSLTWSGRQPGYLVDAIMDRRFDLVYPLAPAGGTGPWEDNYVWKINEVIKANYYRDPRLGAELDAARIAPLPFVGFRAGHPRLRIPGPPPAPWMEHCFGPFDIDGVEWRIAQGGGFWCRPGGTGTELRLVRTIAPTSEIRADDYEGDEDGTVTVALRRPGTVEVTVGGDAEKRELAANQTATFDVPAGQRGLAVVADRGTGARVELGGLSP